MPSHLSNPPPVVLLLPLSSLKDQMGDGQSFQSSICTPLALPSPLLPMHGKYSDSLTDMLCQEMAGMHLLIASLADKVAEKDRPSCQKGASHCHSKQ